MLELQNDLRERISHRNQYIPVTTCVDHFDDYFNRTWECHWHEEVEFSVVLKGSVEYIIFSSEKNTTTVTLHHGEGIYVPSGKLHSVRALQEGTILAGLVFPISFFELTIFDNFYFNNISKVFDSHFPFIYLNTEESIDISITESIIEICGLTGTETGFELYCIELVSRIWRLLTSKMNHLTEKTMFCEESIQTQYMKAMLTFIHSNYGKCITVEEIAKHSGISRTECFRCFKKFLKKNTYGVYDQLSFINGNNAINKYEPNNKRYFKLVWFFHTRIFWESIQKIFGNNAWPIPQVKEP